jgi:2-iminoacetate synthase ThiH
MHLAGSTAPLDHDKAQLAKLVLDAGAIPVRRNTIYSSFEEYEIPKVPERRNLRMAAGD